jgi:hypothetical protein
VFTAQYAMSPYIKQIRFVFKGLICELQKTYPIFGPPCVRSKTCLGFRSHWNFCNNFAPWLPPDFGLMNTSTGLTLADGIGFITNVFGSFSFWNKYVWSFMTLPIKHCLEDRIKAYKIGVGHAACFCILTQTRTLNFIYWSAASWVSCVVLYTQCSTAQLFFQFQPITHRNTVS